METHMEKLQVTLLDSCQEEKDLKRSEEKWICNLGTFFGVGLNSRNEVVNKSRIKCGAPVIWFNLGLTFSTSGLKTFFIFVWKLLLPQYVVYNICLLFPEEGSNTEFFGNIKLTFFSRTSFFIK